MGVNTALLIRVRFLKSVAALVRKRGLSGAEGSQKAASVGRRELRHLGSPVRQSYKE